jgi:pilus assembly protein FimV
MTGKLSMKTRLQCVCATVLLCSFSAIASALGLAEATLYSLLGQKLDCDMELISMGDLSPEELVVSITSPAGFHGGVKASVVKRSDGKAVIKLRSSDVINEPYLEFTVVVRWPQGQLQREVTLLLDTPARR